MAHALILHQETRVSLTPATASEVLHIQTSPSQQHTPFGAGRKRPFNEISGNDEDSYARKYLAVEGSVFHRRKSRAPRSFVWRVFNDRKVLEVQCVDIVRSGRAEKSNRQLTLRIELEDEIVRNGVAFADPEETDALEAFVLTTAGNLYTFSLKRDLLARETQPSEFDASTVFKKFSPSALSFRRAYRMTAVSSLELLISLDDGSFIRLQREANNAGTKWDEQNFSAGGWSGTLRGLVSFKRHQTVRYGDLELEANAFAAMAASPDGKFIWTVGLDHQLLAWSTATGKGKPVLQMDLLGEEDAEGRKQKYVMSAEQGTLMQLVTLPFSPRDRSVAKMDLDEHRKYYLVVHSPKNHQIKFYEVSSHWNSIEGDVPQILDLQPRAVLIPPIDELMNSNIWHLEDFCVIPGANWDNSRLWIRARTGTLCRVFTLSFSLFDEDGRPVELAETWTAGWTTVDASFDTAEALKTYEDFPGNLESMANASVTPTERWLRFIFHPGRFSIATLQTALYVYRKGRGLPSAGSDKGLNAPQLPREQQLAQAVSAKIMLKRMPNEQPDYDKYQGEIQAQWKTFYSLLSHLHSRRHDSIGFSMDTEQAEPWVVSADLVAPIRASSSFERLVVNGQLVHEDLEAVDQEVAQEIFADDEALNLALLLSAARDFRGTLSANFRARFQDAAVEQAVNHTFAGFDDSKERVLALYHSQNFSAEVMDDDFQTLEQSAEALNGLGNLSASAFLAVLEKMDEDAQVKGKDLQCHLRRYGEKVTVAVAQETLQRDRAVLLDMLALVTFMYGDLDQSDLHEEFVSQIGELFEAVVARLKHNELLTWLARNVMSISSDPTKSASDEKDTISVTLLEAIFMSDWEAKAPLHQLMPQLLTIWSKQWTYGTNLHGQWDGVTGHIMAVLVKEHCFSLATEFRQFLSQSEESPSWLRYLEGRLQLALGAYELASIKFQSAAEGMSERKFHVKSIDTAHLLNADEQNFLGAGLSRYYQHISYLFEKARIWSYTANFAQLAISSLDTNEQDLRRSLADIDRRKTNTDSPASSRIDDTMEEIRILKLTGDADDLRNRLFNALVQTGRWESAFEALCLMKNSPPKRAGLKQLIENSVKSEATDVLLSLPFRENALVEDADTILAELARKTLTTGAAGIPWHRILYAFRTQLSDFRGAAQILYQYLQHLQVRYKRHFLQDPEDERLIQVYVLLINAMACCGDGEGWLLAEPIDGKAKRKLVRLEDVRREYVAELDRRSEVLMGRFPLMAAGSAMDEGQGEGMEVDVF